MSCMPIAWSSTALFLFFGALLFASRPGSLVPAALLSVGALACCLRIFRGRDDTPVAAWSEAARELGLRYGGLLPADFLLRFGSPLPWSTWKDAGKCSVPRLISGSDQRPPYWVLDVLCEGAGTAAGYEVTLAIVQIGIKSAGALQRVRVGEKHFAVHNGEYLFVWRRKAPESEEGRKLRPMELSKLAGDALKLAGALHGMRGATPAGASSAKVIPGQGQGSKVRRVRAAGA
jgi:hypothetical protein